MTMFNAKKLTRLGLVAAVAGTMVAAPLVASAGVTGNIGVFSDYVLRGINEPGTGTEGQGPVLQGGVDYSADNGIYLGYWGSNLGYADPSVQPVRGFENDFYGGWGGKTGNVSYSIGVIQYYYLHVSNSDGLEINPTIGYGPVTFGLKYLTGDVAWGNQGDIYWTLSYSTSLPADFSFTALAGYYTYEKSGKYLKDPNPSTGDAASDADFRHLDLTLTHPIGKTGADMSVTYTLPGKDRQDVDQKDAIVFGVTYGFDI